MNRESTSLPLILITYLAILVLAFQAGSVHAIPDDDRPFQKLAAPPGKAVVYIFRSGFNTFELATPVVYLDNKEQGELSLKMYRQFIVSPGNHQIEMNVRRMLSSNKRYRMTIQVDAGKYYYIALHGEVGMVKKTRRGSVRFPKLELVKVEENKALELLDDLYSPSELAEVLEP
ncbi:MAG: hypothetical protein BMS9Abin26_0806 [Gammaproteobacteria bacterium]|nr:MAG: hypothetical protein BMS9Abin26_0806 [Gammaproteobacteria bacterium]